MSIEEIMQLEAEQRLDELRSVRNELAMLHRAIMDMQTKSVTSQQVISLLVGEIRQLRKMVPTKDAVVVTESSCNTESFGTIDASTDTGISSFSSSTMTEQPQTKHVSVGAAPTLVDMGIKTDDFETVDAVVDMGISSVDVCTMYMPSMRDVEVSANPRMKNASSNTVVEVRHTPEAKTNVVIQKQQPSSLLKNGTDGQGEAINTSVSVGQTSRKRKLIVEFSAEPEGTQKEKQRMKIVEKIKSLERIMASIEKRKFGGQVGWSSTEEQCIFCGRDDHHSDNCSVMRSVNERLEYAHRLRICLMCLGDSCSGGPSCPGRGIPCDYCVGVNVINSKKHNRVFCNRPELYEEIKKQLDELYAEIDELDHR